MALVVICLWIRNPKKLLLGWKEVLLKHVAHSQQGGMTMAMLSSTISLTLYYKLIEKQ